MVLTKPAHQAGHQQDRTLGTVTVCLRPSQPLVAPYGNKHLLIRAIADVPWGLPTLVPSPIRGYPHRLINEMSHDVLHQAHPHEDCPPPGAVAHPVRSEGGWDQQVLLCYLNDSFLFGQRCHGASSVSAFESP